jgi:hypothetical protein
VTAGSGDRVEEPSVEVVLTAPAPSGGGAEQDDMVLVLREQGRSFAGIARTLGMDGGLQANAAFNRALRRRPVSEQEGVRSHEIARLDALGERLRQREDLDEAEVARKMRSLDRLRKNLLSV